MSELRSSQSPKKLSGFCYENTVIDRKGRIRKLKPPVAVKPRVLSTQPLILRDSLGEGQEIQHQNDSLNIQPNLNARNTIEFNSNETTNVQRESKNTGEVLDNDASRLGCTEPVWKERPGARQISNPEPCKQEMVTAEQDVARDRQGLVTNKLDLITDVDTYKEVLIKSAQLRFKVQKIRKQKIDRIEDGIVTAAAPDKDDVDATNEHLPQQPTQELNRNVYELALETLEDEEDDDDDEEDDDDDYDEGGAPSRRSESPDTLVERILENMGDDGVVVDFDGDTAPEKPPRRKLYNREKSFSDEILERLGETTSQRSPDVAPTVRNFKTEERSTSSSSSSTKRNGVGDMNAVWVHVSEEQHAEKERRHSELSSAAAAAVIRLDRYIIDQQPVGDVEPKVSYAEREVSDVNPKSIQVEPKISHDEPKLNHVDSKIRDAKPKNSQVKPKISDVEQSNPQSESSFVTSTAALPSDVANQPTVVEAQVFSNLSNAAVQPTETALQLVDPRRLVRERSPEEIFEEIVEAMGDTEGEYEDPFFVDWPEFFLAPRKSPKDIRGPRTGGVPIDYSVENDWLSFFYCNRVNVAGGSAGASPAQRRSSTGNQSQTAPNSTIPAADGVGIFMNSSLSASSSWMARPVRGAFPRTSPPKKPATSEGTEEKGDASQVPKEPEEVYLRSTEPADVVIQSREIPGSISSRSEEQTDFTIGSSSGHSSSMPQNQPDLLLSSPSILPVSSGQSSTDSRLDFLRDDETHRQFAEVDSRSAGSSQSVLQMTTYRNLDTDLESRPTTGEVIQESNTDTKSFPVENPEIVNAIFIEKYPELIAKPETLSTESPEIVNAKSIEKSPELFAKHKSLPVEKPVEVFLQNRPQSDVTVDENPTELLFAALDAAFERNIANTEIKSAIENDIDSGDDSDDTLTPADDISHAVFVQSHGDAAASKLLLKPEPRDSVNDTTGSVNREIKDEKVNEARLEESSGLDRSLEDCKPLENQTERTRGVVEAAVEEDKRLPAHEIAEPSCITELRARAESRRNDDSQHIEESNAVIDVDVPEFSEVSEAEKTATRPSNDVGETDLQQIANRHSVDPVTVHQPHPPKRVVKVLSDEVTTQTILLKIAWSASKLRERSRERSEQPFRELQLRRTIRMSEPGGNVPQIGRQITPAVPAPSLTIQPHLASASGEPLNDQAVNSHSNIVVNRNPVANDTGDGSNNGVASSSGVVTNNDIASSNGVDSSNDVLATHSTVPSSMATKPDFVVEYENQEHSHNTEVTHDATVDVKQTDSVKVLLVPMETVYKVQDLKEIVAAVGRTILNDSRRIPVESNVRVTCEAVQSKSCASLQDRDVTVIKNTILDTYNSSTNSPPVKATETE